MNKIKDNSFYRRYKWIFNAIIVTILLFCSIVFLSYLLKPTSVNRENIIGYYAEEKNTLDVVFIGGSSTYVLYAPYLGWHEYGFTSYDFATDAMAPALLKGMIKEASKTQDPKLYVIDLRAIGWREFNPEYYSDAYIRNITDSLDYSLNRMDMIRYAYTIEHPDLVNKASTYIDLMMYHSKWNTISEKSIAYLFNKYPSEYKGWFFAKTLFHTPLEKYDWSYLTERKQLSPENEKVLIELLEYCKSNDIQALFTLNPICMEDPDEAAYFNTVSDMVASYGYVFLNSNLYYDELAIDFKKDFYDGAHCNLYGAEKYTRFLGKYILENFGLEDKRGNAVYKAWDEGYERWQQAAVKQKKLIDQAIEANNDESN